MRRSATELVKILRSSKWPESLLPEAVTMAMQISDGDNSFGYTLSNGIELAGIFGIEVGGANGYLKGQLWSPVFNAQAALSLYNQGDKWLEFWLAPPVSRIRSDIDVMARHLQMGLPTRPVPKTRTPGGKIG